MTTEEIIKKYIAGNNRHAAYYEAVDIYDHLSFHVDGFKPEQFKGLKDEAQRLMQGLGVSNAENPYFNLLIDQRRPGETIKIHSHRRKIYSSITKEPCFKVINSLKKIVRSDDWKIDYSGVETINRDSENMEDYCEKDFPYFKSLTNWVYSIALPKMLTDPNGAIIVLPLEYDISSNEFLRPFTNYVSSKDILFYTPDEVIVFKSSKVVEQGKRYVPVYYIVSTTEITEVYQSDDKGTFHTEVKMTYDMELPVIINGGSVGRIINNIPLYESFLSPMLPRLDEAAREYSDMQAEVLLHIHSTLAVVQGEDCAKCKGTGKIPKEGGAVVCGDCKGRGALSVDPYDQIVVRVRGVDKQQLPFPPAQYITKDTAIVEIQDKRIDNHIFKALSTLNMEFLAESPLNQSGKAKEVDKEELNNFVYGVAYHLVNNVMAKIYRMISDYRYALIVPNQDKRNKLLPLIQVPEHFDLLTENAMLDQISRATESNIDATIVKEMQVDYINRKYRDTPQRRKQLIASINASPFPTASPEQVIDMELSGTITKLDAVKALYANYFVQILMDEDTAFLDMEDAEQLDKVNKLAEDKIKELEDGKEPLATNTGANGVPGQ